MQNLHFFDEENGQKRICGIICFLLCGHAMIRRRSWLQRCLHFCSFLWSVKTLALRIGWEFSEVTDEILTPNFKRDFYLLASKCVKTLFLQGKMKPKWPSGTCTYLNISQLQVQRCSQLRRIWVALWGVNLVVSQQLCVLHNAFVFRLWLDTLLIIK